MSAAHLLAVVVLVWMYGLGTWNAIDKCVDRTYNSYFYMLVSAAAESVATLAALTVLGAATIWFVLAWTVIGLAALGRAT